MEEAMEFRIACEEVQATTKAFKIDLDIPGAGPGPGGGELFRRELLTSAGPIFHPVKLRVGAGYAVLGAGDCNETGNGGD